MIPPLPASARHALAHGEPGTLVHSVMLAPVTITQLAFYCACVGVTDPIHYDRSFARAAGFGDAVVNGSLRVAWMGQVLHDWLQSPAGLHRLQCEHRGVMLVGAAPCIEVRLAGTGDRGSAAQPGERDVELRTLDGDRLCDRGTATLRLPRADPS